MSQTIARTAGTPSDGAHPDGPPAPAAGAYRRSRTPKQMEAEVFARATRALRGVETGGPLATARAIADNRRLWDAVHDVVVDPANALPAPLRARIASIALTVIRECEAESPDLAFIAETNEHFAAALWA